MKRTTARIKGAQLAAAAAASEGAKLAAARHRRRWTQQELADKVGISRSRLAGVEAGRGATLPLEVWFALAQALGLYLRFEWARDPQTELGDAGHLDILELVLRVAALAGWERAAEARSGSWGSDRSIDVRLIDRGGRRLAVNECLNTFGDLGASFRSSDRKVDDAQQLGVAIADDGEPFQVGLCWVVRDTKAKPRPDRQIPAHLRQPLSRFERRLGSGADQGRAAAEAARAHLERSQSDATVRAPAR